MEKDKQGKIIKFFEKSQDFNGDCANGALYAFDKEFLSFLEKMETNPYDFSNDIIPKLLGKIFSYHTLRYYFDIGNLASYEKANNIAKKIQNTLDKQS